MNTAILVCGMHRGGTSAAARAISLMGAQLPGNLMTPSESINPRGFWESVDIADANDHFLAATGSSWDDPRRLSGKVFDSAAALELETKASRLLERDFPEGGLIVLKDPRFSRTLPLWRRALERLDYEVRVVLVTRHPLEVSASLARRDGFAREKCLRLWLRYLLDAEHTSRDCRRYWVGYDRLLEDWEDTLNLQSVWPDLSWSRSLDVIRNDISEFLSKDLRHHRRAANDLDEVHLWVREAYELAVAAQTADDTEHHRVFDQLRHHFNEAELLLGPNSGWPIPVTAADPSEVKPFLRKKLGALTDRVSDGFNQTLESVESAVELGKEASSRIEWLESELTKTREEISALHRTIETYIATKKALERSLRLRTHEAESASFERVRLYAELRSKTMALETTRSALKTAEEHHRKWLVDLLAATSRGAGEP